jgi:tetratricopeptide (TPR) repeat protein
MSFHLEDEHLLLSYLLLEEDIERRTEIYESFYNNYPGLGLRELNDLVKDGEKLDEKSITNSTIGFEHFLISFHVSNNNVTSDEFFNQVKTLWQQTEGSSVIPTASKSYQIASILKAYYETGEYGSINGLYNEFHHLQKLPHSKIKLNLLWGAEFALYRLGHVDKSLETQRKFTIPISNFLELNSTLNSILASHGGYLYQIGKYQEAKNYFLSILDQS